MNLVKASLYASAHTYCTGYYCDLLLGESLQSGLNLSHLSADYVQTSVSPVKYLLTLKE